MQAKRALIFVNGELADLTAAARLVCAEDFLVAADGGMKHLRRLGRLPSLLVGDLDSLSAVEIKQAKAAGVEVLAHPPAKNETDLELALAAVIERGYTEIIIVAALGGRLDQTLGNLFLLTQPALAACNVRLDDGIEEVFLIRSVGVVEGRAGDRVSLLPAGSPVRGVVTSGLLYPLRSETLLPHWTRGISNVMDGSRAEIRISRGRLFCIHTRQPDILLEKKESDVR